MDSTDSMNSVGSAEELGSVFTDALTEVIATVSGFSFDVIAPPPESSESEEDNSFSGMIGIMSLVGSQKNIMFFLSAEESDMKVLCSFMSGVAQDEITREDMNDALCELANMTAGNVKLRTGGADYMFGLSLPFAINGEKMSIVTKKRVNVFSRALGNGDISVKLKIVC